ncbi:hypothetical protein UlMin_032972 [Ulmus minor]
MRRSGSRAVGEVAEMVVEPFYPPLTLRTHMGGHALVSFVCRSCIVMRESHRLLADLIVLPMTQFDVILGMDRLSTYQTIINFHWVRVIIGTEDGGMVTYQANQVGKHSYIMVVDEYPNVFPYKLPGLPPKREIEFCIDLIPGTSPVSISPYHMAPTKMTELRKQLQELINKVFFSTKYITLGSSGFVCKEK